MNIKKDQLKRLLAETVIFMALFFWLPIIYQIALTVIFSIISEYVYIYLAKRSLINNISDDAISKIGKTMSKEKKNALSNNDGH
jgi:hypothetical protein